FCVAIFALPIIGLASGRKVLREAKRASGEAAKVDGVTQALFADEAFFTSHHRGDLEAQYARDISEGATLDLTLDALRRAYSDRWDNGRRLAEAYAGRISSRLSLIAVLQRTALQTGILGAFVGLLYAFQANVFKT